MAIRGRKPKPTELKILEGNLGHRKINENEIKPTCGGVECPEWLTGEGREEWEKLAPVLRCLGLLTKADVTVFAGYCQAYARWREAERYISENGMTFATPSGYVQQVPQVSISQTNFKLMMKCAEQFGLTPSARCRLVSGDVGGGDDDMENVLGEVR
mgnify:CR=1 FL=1